MQINSVQICLCQQGTLMYKTFFVKAAEYCTIVAKTVRQMLLSVSRLLKQVTEESRQAEQTVKPKEKARRDQTKKSEKVANKEKARRDETKKSEKDGTKEEKNKENKKEDKKERRKVTERTQSPDAPGKENNKESKKDSEDRRSSTSSSSSGSSSLSSSSIRYEVFNFFFKITLATTQLKGTACEYLGHFRYFCVVV